MSWQKRFRLRDDVGSEKSLREPRGAAAPVALTRTAETEVRSVLKGLARRHDMTVGEVARKLESGLWSRDYCLGSMRIQWAFEKLCEEERFTEPSAAKPRPAREARADSEDPRAA